MWPLLTYSNYFEIVSTVTFYSREPDSFEVAIFLFNTVLLYSMIIQGKIFTAPGF